MEVLKYLSDYGPLGATLIVIGWVFTKCLKVLRHTRIKGRVNFEFPRPKDNLNGDHSLKRKSAKLKS
jgi:hypothetical protein